jgi:hypothetical protein
MFPDGLAEMEAQTAAVLVATHLPTTWGAAFHHLRTRRDIEPAFCDPETVARAREAFGG